jgi:hypothetical protein
MLNMNLEKLDYWIACQLADINERLKEGVVSDSFEYLIGAKHAYEAIRAQMTLVRYLEKE